MDFFDGNYYRLSKILLCCIGRWPYQSKWIGNSITVFMSLVVFTQIIAKVFGIIACYPDVDRIMSNLIPISCHLIISVKMINCVMKTNQLEWLVSRIQRDWDSDFSDRELEIMKEHAEIGRRNAKSYTRILMTIGLLVVLDPVLPKIVHPKEPLKRTLHHDVRYFVDLEEYFFPIVFHLGSAIIIIVIENVAFDTTYVILIQHACGLFSAIGYRIEHAGDEEHTAISLQSHTESDRIYRTISSCAQRHIEALEFAEALKNYNSMSFLVQTGLNMITLSLSGIHMLLSPVDSSASIRTILYPFILLNHLYFQCTHAQRLIDCSSGIHEHILCSSWYKMSIKTQNNLRFILMKSRVPCTLTVGKLATMSMEFFGVTLKSSMSFFTVLRSVH